MDWSKFLTPETVATYMVFIAGLIVGLIGFLASRWLARQHPRKITLMKISESSLLEIDPEVRDEIAVMYKNKPTKSLYLTTFILQNAGQEIVDNIEITISFRETEIIEMVLDGPLPKRASWASKPESNDRARFHFSFLNPIKLYNDKVKIKVFSLKPIQVENVSGGGRGWKVEFFDRVQLISDIGEELSLLKPSEYIFPPTMILVMAMRIFVKFFPRFLRIVTQQLY